MSRTDDLYALLEDQSIAQDSDEMKEIREHRAAIEDTIKDAFPGTDKTIKYGGSKAKGTMILESYDLDMIVYVHDGENGLGDTLEEIYENIADALSDDYHIERKNCALRLSARTSDTETEDLFIDVVPGRYVDYKRGDTYLHQNEGDKTRLKTNLDIHIDHIKDSGVTDALKLLKLMRVRHDLDVKQFALDLLGVDLLDGKSGLSLDDQLVHALTQIKDSDIPLTIEDPANPQGNDLSDYLSPSIWSDLQQIATTMLSEADENGWGSAYGEADVFDAAPAIIVNEAVEAVDVPTQPWMS